MVSSGPQSEAGHFGHPGEVCGSLAANVEHVAKEVDPSRLKFHGVLTFDPCPFLDNYNRQKFQFPLDFALDPSTCNIPIPNVTVRCKQKSCIALLELMDSSNRLALLPFDAIRKGLECGLFSVPKDGQRDRLIMDARPANSCETSDSPWIRSLASLQQLQHVFLEDHQNLIMQCEDLREFYHSFLIGDQRRCRNALKIQVKPDEVKHLKCFAEWMAGYDRLVPVLNTMAMGDTNSVTFGQVSHLSVLLRTGEFAITDFLTLTGRPSRSSWHAGLMIDDFVLLEKLPKGADPLISPGVQKIQKVREMYTSVGLPRHPDKAVSASLKAEFWGAQVDGEAGLCRPNLKRLVPLAHILLRIIDLKVATVGLLEILSGALVSAFQMRRRFMSCLSEIYAAQRGRDRTDVVLFSRQLIDELLICVGLLPMTILDLRIKPCPLVVASDASSMAEAAVAADLGKVFVTEAQRHGLQKGLWNRLLSPAGAYLREHGQLDETEELPDEQYEMHPLWEEVVKSFKFEQFGRVLKSKKRQHINLREVSAALAAESRVGLLYPDSFYISLQDSQVSLACLVKGRSSSFYLNKLLRRSIADHVGQNVKGFYGFVRSKLNPADDPTRDVAIRPKQQDPPEFLNAAMRGDFDPMDAFLKTWGLDIPSLANLPDASELYADAFLDCRSHTAVKRDRAKLVSEKKKKLLKKASRERAEGLSCPGVVTSKGGPVPSSSSTARAEADAFSSEVFGPGTCVGGCSDGLLPWCPGSAENAFECPAEEPAPRVSRGDAGADVQTDQRPAKVRFRLDNAIDSNSGANEMCSQNELSHEHADVSHIGA